MESTTLIRDVGEGDFEIAVIERSQTVPVVVDFWAPWCAPCRVLGPLLEREVKALGGRVELAKVNTDANPELASRYGIQGIPALKAFANGTVAKEVTGLQPAEALRRWLEDLAPPASRKALAVAQERARSGDLAGAEMGLRALLEDETVRDEAAVALAHVLLDGGRPEEAETVVNGVPERSLHAEAADAVRRRIQFARDADAFGGLEPAAAAVARNPGDLEARFALASAHAAASQWEAALAELIEIVKRSRKFRDDAARHAMLAIFEHLGPRHPAVSEYRRQLQIVT